MSEPTTESLALPVLGMTCAACQHHVEGALQQTNGVKSAHVDLMANRASVVFDPQMASPEDLVEAIRRAGYDAVLPRPGESDSAERTKETTASYDRKARTTLGAGGAAMLLAMPLGAHMGFLDHLLMCLVPWLYSAPQDLIRWTLLFAAGSLMFWSGGSIYANAARGLRRRTSNMNTLVSLG